MELTESELKRLALFPEQNPNPVIEVDAGSGNVTYQNPAAKKRFPDLKETGIKHPLLSGVHTENKKDFQREIDIDGKAFEQKIYFIPGTDLIRVYSHDITEQKNIQKNLSRLASFPEQNPSPIVEIDLEGIISYTNPACRQIFSDPPITDLQHEVLAPLAERLEKFRTGEIKNYVCEIKIGDHYYSQRARYMEDIQVIRIFNNDITHQKKTEELVREKNKDITDSINYARKIQHAILPTEDLVHSELKDYFILYKPKDIISGDFYWFTSLENYFLFACADCTGHGVPGALMSMIGSNTISLIVSDKEIISPGTILNELDVRVRKALKQDGESESRDGMDLAFCSLEVHKNTLHYAGANRPIAVVRNGELTEYAPTKFPIGGQYDVSKNFDNNTIQLQKGDCVYLFTDGITDQFGGPKGKKFMKKKFYELLLASNRHSMQEQSRIIFKAFEEWRGDLEQVDDVCVIGIRIH
jgi:serine phosphatase RsbU (regulator of sigma subunit)